MAAHRALVTGAGGFIGTHLVERLVRDGWQVKGLVRYNSRQEQGALDWLPGEVTSEVEVIAGDIRDAESAARAIDGAEVVFHLAAQIAIPYSYVNPRDFFETNVLGSLNVAQAALGAGVNRVVHVSTSEVYGSARELPITEDHPLHIQSPYAASKAGADGLMTSFHRSFGLPVAIVRPFNTYGPRQSARAVIPTIVTQALAGGVVRLGALDPRRDLTYASDTAAGLLAAASAQSAPGRIVQLGSGEDASVGELVDIVGDLLGTTLEVSEDSARIRPADSEVDRLLSSPALAREILNWKPEVGLRDGLRRTIEWIERNAERYRVGTYAI